MLTKKPAQIVKLASQQIQSYLMFGSKLFSLTSWIIELFPSILYDLHLTVCLWVVQCSELIVDFLLSRKKRLEILSWVCFFFYLATTYQFANREYAYKRNVFIDWIDDF